MKALAIALVAAASALQLAGQTYFSDNFDTTGLGQWTGTPNTSAVLVDDGGAHGWVIAFAETRSGGDAYTSGFTIPDVANLRISFDYKGDGGFLGFRGTASNNHWLAGSQSGYSSALPYTVLSANGDWHHYDIAIPTSEFGRTIMLEDYAVTSGAERPRDAYFDNIRVYSIPEPSTYALILGACTLGLVGWRRFRK